MPSAAADSYDEKTVMAYFFPGRMLTSVIGFSNIRLTKVEMVFECEICLAEWVIKSNLRILLFFRL